MSTQPSAAEPTAAPPILAPSAQQSQPGTDTGPPTTPPPPADPTSPQPPAPPAEPPKPVEDQAVTRGLEIVARKEAEVRAREQQLKAAEAELKQFRQLRELAKQPGKRASVLEAIGLSYEDVTNDLLDQAPQNEPAAKVAALEQRLAHWENEYKQAQQAQQVANGKAIVKGLISQQRDKYEHINALGMHDRVFDRAAEHYQRDGVQPDIDAIAAEVEKELEEQYAKPLLGLKRYAGRTQPAAPASSNGNQGRANGPTTLTNRSASDGVLPTDEELPMDPHARTQALAARFPLWGPSAE